MCQHNEETIDEPVEENKDGKLLKQRLASSIQTFSNQEVTDLCKDYEVYTWNGKEVQFDRQTQLKLDLNKDNHLEFLTKINKRIPDCGSVWLNSVPEENEVVKTFLGIYFPNKVGELHLNEASNINVCLSFYMDELEALSSKVKQSFVICNFEISQHQMKTLFDKYKLKRYFGFYGCELALSSKPDFGGALQGSKLRVLDFIGCGSRRRGDWKNNPSHFENLIEGLVKEQDFKNNLKEIGMLSCGMEESQVKKILKKYKLGKVKINI